MAFISEIHYRTGDVNPADPSTHEFVEIALAPGENPADFVLGFYGNDGALMDDPGDNIQATGVVDGEVTLSSLTGVPDPENPGWTIYTITSTSSVFELVNATRSQVSDEANYVALTNTATGVVSGIGIGRNPPVTLSGGAADGGMTIEVDRVGAGESVQFDSDGNNISGPRSADNAEIVCFCAGTEIALASGPCLVENLNVGDLVVTLDHGDQPIRWIGRRTLRARHLAANPKLRPVRLSKGSLGNGLPKRDLLVSRQHRMLVSSRIAKRMFGTETALVAAIKLTALPGVFVDEEISEVTYFHLLFDAHEVIFADGAPSESLYLGEHGMSAMGPEARAEISAIFPGLSGLHSAPVPAAHLPSNKEQKALAQRHAKNQVPVLEGVWR